MSSENHAARVERVQTTLFDLIEQAQFIFGGLGEKRADLATVATLEHLLLNHSWRFVAKDADESLLH